MPALNLGDLMKKQTLKLSILSWLIASAAVFAHSGHGVGGGSNAPLHYLAEPGHLGLFVLVACTVTALAFRMKKAKVKK